MLPQRILFIIISGFVMDCCGITFMENPIVNNTSEVESRQSKSLSFFPIENPSNENNYIDNNHTNARQYYSPSSVDTTAGDQVFTFSNNARPINPSNNYEFNTGEYVNGNPINYVTINPQRVPPTSRPRPPPPPPPQRRPYSIDQQRPQGNYAQYFNYNSNTPQKQPFYNNDIRPQLSQPPRPPQSPPPNNYYYTNQNRPIYQSQLPPNFNINNFQNPNGGINQPQFNSPGNYAGNYQNYQTQDTGNPITNFFNNIGQGASNLLNGGSFSDQPSNQYQPGYQQPPQLQQQQQYPVDPSNPVSQFGKAIEEITRHDDLQCIPKIICQMVGNQRRQNSLSPLLGSPVFSSLISAVPSTSAGLVYGRAALLGYTAGEHRCDGAYPKCPRNEDNLLYYLNNHRGGFFRFFNGGAAYGNPDEIQYNPNYHNYNLVSSDGQQQQNQQQQPFGTSSDSTATNLALLTGLANAINQSGGINLSNLGANSGVLGNIANFVGGGMTNVGGLASNLFSSQSTGGGGQDTSTGTYNVGEIFSNLLTGFVGNRFSSRNLKKRSVDMETTNDKMANSAESSTIDLAENLKSSNETVKENIKPENSTTGSGIDVHNDEDEKEEIFAEDEYDGEVISSDSLNDNVDGNDNDVPQGRIINLKNPILSINQNNKIQFPSVEKNIVRDGKKVQFVDSGNKNDEPFQQSTNKDILLFDTNIKGPNVFRFSDQSNSELNFSKKTKIKFDNDNNLVNQIVGPTPTPLLLDTTRGSKKIKFNNDKLTVRLPNGINPPSVDRIRMVFPDRTGTGNLRFDNEEFTKQNEHQIRFGRILTGSRFQLPQSQQPQQNPINFNSDNLSSYYDRYQSPINRYGSDNQQSFNSQSSNNYYQRPIAVASPSSSSPLSSSSSLYNKGIGSNNYYTNNNNNNNYNNHHSSNYNSQSQQGTNSENIYVTNSKGVVEYYINPTGNKVYV